MPDWVEETSTITYPKNIIQSSGQMEPSGEIEENKDIPKTGQVESNPSPYKKYIYPVLTISGIIITVGGLFWYAGSKKESSIP